VSKLNREKRSDALALLLAGQSHNAIAKQVGRSQSTVSAFAQREGTAPVNGAPREAIERRKEFALGATLETTGELMAKVLEIAETAEAGREIKECAVAWGVLCDNSAIMEGLPLSRTEMHTTRGSTIDLEQEWAKLDAQMEREGLQETEYGSPQSPGFLTGD
jgi:hypothetical protein